MEKRGSKIKKFFTKSLFRGFRGKKSLIACLEEIAYNRSLVTKGQILTQVKELRNNGYRQYLHDLIHE